MVQMWPAYLQGSILSIRGQKWTLDPDLAGFLESGKIVTLY
jgi:hypothetical protein